MTTMERSRLQERQSGFGFRAVGLRQGDVPMGHILGVDHFHMSEPTFSPRPHAGFSAVTYILEDSEGSFHYSDSRGSSSVIPPGALHWTRAGSGVVRNDVPEDVGTDCHGLQILVKLPPDYELDEPQTAQLDPAQIPTVTTRDAQIKVIAGAYGDMESPLDLFSHTTLLDVQLKLAAVFTMDIPQNVEAFALVLAGIGRVNLDRITPRDAVSLPSGQPTQFHSSRRNTPLRLLVGYGDPMPYDVYWQGPFCMSQRDRLADAEDRYRQGHLGVIRG